MPTKNAICCGALAVAAIGSGNKAINETILFGILAERAIELSVTPSFQETLFCSALAVGATELSVKHFVRYACRRGNRAISDAKRPRRALIQKPL